MKPVAIAIGMNSGAKTEDGVQMHPYATTPNSLLALVKDFGVSCATVLTIFDN
jgi:hypothetical protein